MFSRRGGYVTAAPALGISRLEADAANHAGYGPHDARRLVWQLVLGTQPKGRVIASDGTGVWLLARLASPNPP